MARKNLSSLTALGSDSESAPTQPAAQAPKPAAASATQPAIAHPAETAPAESAPSPRAPRAAAKRSTATSSDRGGAETATKGVPVHLTEELNERLQAYMARKRWSHQTVLLDAIEATYARLPELIDEATLANEESVERTPLFDRPARPVHTATGEARVKHTVRMTNSNRKTLDDITENLGAPSRNFLITVAYEAYLPTIEKS